MTVWRVINRLAGHRRARRHDPLGRPPRSPPTSCARAWSARFWIVPFNTGWHLAHHVDMGVPFRNLPAPARRARVEAGWVTADLEYPSYRALWRALSSARRAEPA